MRDLFSFFFLLLQPPVQAPLHEPTHPAEQLESVQEPEHPEKAQYLAQLFMHSVLQEALEHVPDLQLGVLQPEVQSEPLIHPLEQPAVQPPLQLDLQSDAEQEPEQVLLPPQV